MRLIPNTTLRIGDRGDLRDPATLHRAGIQALIDVALNEPLPTMSRELAFCRFPLLDGTGNPPWIVQSAVQTTAALLRSNVPTLVCCSSGMSRSPSIGAGALALATGRAPRECLMDILATGPGDISRGIWDQVERCITMLRLLSGLPRDSG